MKKIKNINHKKNNFLQFYKKEKTTLFLLFNKDV